MIETYRTIRKIREIAKEVRDACRDFAFSDEGGLYDFYCDDELGCMCAIASYALREKLATEGIDTTLMHGEVSAGSEHCWLEWDNKFIIDITASQFNYLVGEGSRWSYVPRVYITKISDKKYENRLFIHGNYDTFEPWPSSQQPHPAITERILELL